MSLWPHMNASLIIESNEGRFDDSLWVTPTGSDIRSGAFTPLPKLRAPGHVMRLPCAKGAVADAQTGRRWRRTLGQNDICQPDRKREAKAIAAVLADEQESAAAAAVVDEVGARCDLQCLPQSPERVRVAAM